MHMCVSGGFVVMFVRQSGVVEEVFLDLLVDISIIIFQRKLSLFDYSGLTVYESHRNRSFAKMPYCDDSLARYPLVLHRLGLLRDQ
jgi:hypothetical protein